MKTISMLLSSFALTLAISAPAFADVGFVPEPGALSLLAIGIGAAVLVRSRRKK